MKNKYLQIIEGESIVSARIDETLRITFVDWNEKDISYNCEIYYYFIRNIVKKFSSIRYKDISCEEIREEIIKCFDEILLERNIESNESKD